MVLALVFLLIFSLQQRQLAIELSYSIFSFHLLIMGALMELLQLKLALLQIRFAALRLQSNFLALF